MAIGTTAAIIAGTVASGAISAGASVLGAKEQGKAARSAAAAQAAALDKQLELQRYVYDQQREDTAPWREIGERSLVTIEEGYKAGVFDPSNFNFEADPGYAFRQAEGEKAMERAAAARGDRLSGGQAKNLLRFNQNLASDEYSRAWNRNLVEKTTNFNQLAATANVGQTGVAQVNAAGQNYANSAGNAIMANGNNQANGFLRAGQAQAGMYHGIAGAANQGMQNMLLYNMLGNE